MCGYLRISSVVGLCRIYTPALYYASRYLLCRGRVSIKSQCFSVKITELSIVLMVVYSRQHVQAPILREPRVKLKTQPRVRTANRYNARMHVLVYYHPTIILLVKCSTLGGERERVRAQQSSQQNSNPHISREYRACAVCETYEDDGRSSLTLAPIIGGVL